MASKIKVSYPWAAWLKATRLTLVRGRDFAVAPYCMAQQFRNKCRRRGLGVSLAVGEDRIEVVLGEQR